ncbi:MAG: hypothetical protein ACXACY_10245 [Candidatus Hodarchaeales archaeon]|jgi:hypothetical protein
MKSNTNKRGLIPILIIGFALLFGVMSINVLAQSSDTATGTVTIGNATPTVEDIEIVNSTYDIVTAWDPDNSGIFGVNATVGDTNQLADLVNVTWYIFDDSVHGTDYDTASATGNDLVIVWWNESNDLWTIDQGAFTEWDIQSAQDPGAASSASSYEFTARFDISRATYYDTDWNVSVVVFDEADATNESASGSLFTMNKYYEIDYLSTTFAWGTVSSLSTNNTMLTNYTMNIWANFNSWEIAINGSDMTAGGQPDVDLETNDSVVWSETGAEDTTSSLWVRNTQTVGLGNWDAQSRMTTESAISREVHLWFTDTGFHTTNEEYSITIWFELRDDT